jgi:putative oxidoreductase
MTSRRQKLRDGRTIDTSPGATRRRSMWLINLLDWGRSLAERIPYSFVALVARFAVASVFWRSGQTKVEGFFMIKENTFYLFREEYMVPLVSPDLAAYLSTIAEHVFPTLLVIGLASRLSALGLLSMTAVIQLFGAHPLGRGAAPDHRPRTWRHLTRSSDLEPGQSGHRACPLIASM